MKKKTILSLLSVLFMTGCGSNIEENTYRCYLGKMMVSTFSMANNDIDHKKIQAEEIDDACYTNMYFLKSQKELDDFYSNPDYTISQTEKDTNRKLKETMMLVYFIMDTPKGYRAYKRDNMQGVLKDQGLTLLTDNFYYYASKPDIFFCQIDLKEDSSITKSGTYSFYYQTSRKYADYLSEDSIRVIYNIK